MSLRTRLLLTFGVLALATVGAAFWTVRTVERRLVEQTDAQIDNASRFERFDRGPDRGRGSDHPEDHPDDHEDPQEDPPLGGFNTLYVAELVGGSIERIASPDVSGDSYPDPLLDAAAVEALVDDASRGPDHFTVAATDESSLRYRISIRQEPPDDRTYIIGAPLDAVDAAVRAIQRTAFGLAALTLALLALAAWWLTRLGLRPIKQMTAAAEGIAAGSLSQRVPLAPAATEAGQLGGALNGMLARLEESFDERTRTEQRLRQFAADASHELRTPVQTIRGYGELFRMGALDDDERLVDAMRRTEQEATRMGRIIDDLLLLARLDQQRPMEQADVDVTDIALDAVSDARAIQPHRLIDFSSDEPVVVRGDQLRLRQVLANLLTNAVVHTPVESRITVFVRGDRDSGTATIEVADSGPGMDAVTAAQVFERFYRSDQSRSRASGGSGLGLSIVRGIVEAHGGSVTLMSSEQDGTSVRLTLPLARRSTALTVP